MAQAYRIYDSDAHVMMTQRHWQDLPPEYHLRRPRPAQVGDTEGLGGFTSLWFVEGRLLPHPWGPGSQPGNIPVRTYDAFPGTPTAFDVTEGSQDLSDPAARLKDLDKKATEAAEVKVRAENRGKPQVKPTGGAGGAGRPTPQQYNDATPAQRKEWRDKGIEPLAQ